MVDTIYVEVEVEDHHRTQEILARYPKANNILIQKYSEVFNSHSQNFRTQKTNPSLILCLLYTSPSPRDLSTSRMPSSA